jgi:hypothetical protein
MNELVVSEYKSQNLNWRKVSLRKCLLALGISNEEMRFRVGARMILDSWTGEVETLYQLAKSRWKEKVARYHEANNGGDPEMWLMYNQIFTAIEYKLGYRKKGRVKKGRPTRYSTPWNSRLYTWAQWFRLLTPKEQEEYRKKATANFRKRVSLETPEKREARRARNRIYCAKARAKQKLAKLKEAA